MGGSLCATAMLAAPKSHGKASTGGMHLVCVLLGLARSPADGSWGAVEPPKLLQRQGHLQEKIRSLCCCWAAGNFFHWSATTSVTSYLVGRAQQCSCWFPEEEADLTVIPSLSGVILGPQCPAGPVLGSPGTWSIKMLSKASCSVQLLEQRAGAGPSVQNTGRCSPPREKMGTSCLCNPFSST